MVGPDHGRVLDNGERVTTSTLDRDVNSLREQIDGQIITPTDPGYDDARAVWNGSIDRRPAAVVSCHGADDVRRALDLATGRELPVAVRGGGHNVAGFGTVDDGVVIDTRPMQAVVVDPDARTATAGAGTLGRELDAATQEHALATTTGVMSTTGIAGLTLGGGIGWLQRSLGLTCDNLLAAEMVTVGGRHVRASSDEHPELFWALRGGGGNFGVVTSFTYRVHPVGPEVFCGLTAWRGEDTAEVLSMLRDRAPQVPDELMVVAVHRTAPPAPWLDETHHGAPIVALAACYAGPLADAEAPLAPLRTFGDPIVDIFAPRPYTAWQSLFDASWDPGFRNYWKAEYVRELTDDAIAVLAEYAVSHTSPLSDFKVGLMGGAVSRVPETATACGHRDAAFVLNINTRWTDPAEDPRHIAHTRRLFDEFRGATPSAGSTYVNFLGDEGSDRVREAYSDATFARLREIKRSWDPDNVLRINQNIAPAR